MSLALAITDNADGTGAVATISGGDAGTLYTVSAQRVDGNLGAGTWAGIASRTGNGIVSLPITDMGLYWFVAQSVASISPLVYAAVTDGLTAIFEQCLLATQARLRLLALADIDGDSILVKKLPAERIWDSRAPMAILPALIVTPVRDVQQPATGVVREDDVTYSVMVTIVAGDNQEATLEANLSRHLKWKEQIARAFRHQRLPGAPLVWFCSVQPIEAVISQAWKANMLATAVILNFTAREPRGLGA